MWWDLDNGKYEIPNGGGKHSMFAGALWIGGLDDQGNLKVAGMTYRQDGNDFWPGPLNADVASDDYGTTTQDLCTDFDKHYVITRQEVEDYVGYNNCLADPSCDVATSYLITHSPKQLQTGLLVELMLMAHLTILLHMKMLTLTVYTPLELTILDMISMAIRTVNLMMFYLAIKHYGGCLMIMEIFIRKQDRNLQ